MSFIGKFFSRKFLVGVSTIIAGLVMVFVELEADQAVVVSQKIAGAVTALMGALGYMNAEAKVDAS